MKIRSFFDKNIALLSLSTLLSQLIPLALSPILTRIFSPEIFGEFSLYLSIIMILSVLATGRYEYSIILPAQKEDSRHLTLLSIFIACSVSFILLILTFFYAENIAQLFHLKNSVILYFIPFTLLVLSMNQSFNYWMNKNEDYMSISISRVLRSLFTGIVSILIGLFWIKKIGLIIGDIIGLFISTLQMQIKIFKDHPHFYKKISLNTLKTVAKRYDQFPKLNVASGLLEKSSSHLPALLLSYLFNNQVVGFFSLSQRVVGAPGSVIAKSYGDVFRQKANKSYLESNHCREEFMHTFKSLLTIAVVPFLLLFIFSPFLFEFVFGKEWFESGIYTRALCLMYFFQFITNPLSNMFYVAEKQNLDLYMQIGLFICLSVGIYIVSIIFKNPLYSVIVYSFIYSLKYIFEFIVSYNLSLGKNNHYGSKT